MRRTNKTTTSRTELSLDVVPNIDEIIKAVKAVKADPAKTDAKKTKNKRKATAKKKPKPAMASGGGSMMEKDEPAKFERDGLAMVLGKEFPFTIGPVPLVVEVGFSVGFGFGFSAKLILDRQTFANMNEPLYPCLGTERCFERSNTPMSFTDANDDCRFKGGRLAQLQSADDVSAVVDAVADAGATSEFWVGGQLAYLYADPTCANARNPPQSCLTGSSTQYAWLNALDGGVAFGRTNGTDPTPVDPTRYVANHGLGTGSLGALTTQVPTPAGVLFRKSTGKLATAVATTTKPFVCQFDPAKSYSEVAGGFEVAAEFSAGVSAAVCTPTNKIGFCLSAELQFITAGLKIEALRRGVTIYGQNDRRTGSIGGTSLIGSWELSFLSGAINAELRFLLSTQSWNIVSFDGLKTFEGTIFELTWPYRKGAP